MPVIMWFLFVEIAPSVFLTFFSSRCSLHSVYLHVQCPSNILKVIY